MTKYFALAVALGFFAAILFTHNPFGNQPDAIADESYFLTSALSSVQKHTLPGWEFSYSGTYYGGPQEYLDAAAMVPALGVVFAAEHFSVHNTMVWVALNTGQLLHVLRLVNGLIVFLAIAGLSLFFIRKRISRETAQALALFLFVILGSSVVALFEHTAKVWVLQLTLDACIGALLIAQEIETSRGKPAIISKPRLAALLVWAGVLTFFQTYAGVASIVLYTLYALLLGHVSLKDFFNYLRRWWWLILIFALTQISFLYRAFYAREQGASPTSYVSAVLSSGRGSSIALAHRLLDPPVLSFLSQPFVLLYPLLLALVLLSASYRSALGHTKRALAIACVHPVLVWLIFYALFGFSITVRYTGPLIIACAFSVALLVATRGWFMKVLLAAVIALAIVVQIFTGRLWWGSSTNQDLVTFLTQANFSSSTVIAVDPSAGNLQLPMNARSLSLLDTKHQQMGRYAFLLGLPGGAGAANYFAPTVLYDAANTPPNNADYLITSTPSGPPEITDLLALLSTRELGAVYQVRPLTAH